MANQIFCFQIKGTPWMVQYFPDCVIRVRSLLNQLEIFPHILLIGNRPTGSCNFVSLWKIYSCLFMLNCTRNHVITYTSYGILVDFNILIRSFYFIMVCVSFAMKSGWPNFTTQVNMIKSHTHTKKTKRYSVIFFYLKVALRLCDVHYLKGCLYKWLKRGLKFEGKT